ncbi:MAG TPA: hypothetical protein VGY31_17560 [Terriglobia bacterium]|nr:hypothetical protein [Terriglobia bacterium]
MSSDPLVPVAYKDRRGWLTAFGVAEILIACLFLLLALLMLLIPFTRPPGQAPVVTPQMQVGMKIFGFAVYAGFAALFLLIGIGSIMRKNWARITMLVVSALWLAAGVLATVVIMLMMPTLMHTAGQIPPATQRWIFGVMTTMMAILMIVIPAIFLFFYSRKSVKATCQSGIAGQIPGASSGVPVPIIILTIWQGLGVITLFSYLLLKSMVVFGIVLHGAEGFLVALACSAVSLYAAWLIYHRKFTGWVIALCYAVFWTAGSIVTFAGHDINTVYRQMGLWGKNTAAAIAPFPQAQAIIWLSCLFFLVVFVAFLLYTRKFFVRAQGAQ